MDEKAENDRLYEYLGRTTSQLSEHFDAIQIIASKLDAKGNTVTMAYGSGNWHAPGGIAAEITQCGDVKLSFVSAKNGFAVSVGPLHRDMVQAALWIFRHAVTRLNELHG